nr:MOSC N-terminal beta barrel domain-containing protein [uncultured Deefgea sp.]
MMTLSAIFRYPLKSCRAQSLTTSLLTERGLQFDREWMVATAEGKYITGRTEPRLLLIDAEPTSDGLWLKAPNCVDLFVPLGNFSETHLADVWENEFLALRGALDADAWLSAYLGQQVHLMWTGLESHRRVKRHPEIPVGFADTYPLLLIGEGSLRELSHRIGRDMSMLRFRPNLVIANSEPFAEDTWQRIRIADVEFQLGKSCERCIMTTLDPDTAAKTPDSEPLRSLAKFRKIDGAVVFGQNILALSAGELRRGMSVEVLSFL